MAKRTPRIRAPRSSSNSNSKQLVASGLTAPARRQSLRRSTGNATPDASSTVRAPALEPPRTTETPRLSTCIPHDASKSDQKDACHEPAPARLALDLLFTAVQWANYLKAAAQNSDGGSEAVPGAQPRRRSRHARQTRDPPRNS